MSRFSDLSGSVSKTHEFKVCPIAKNLGKNKALRLGLLFPRLFRVSMVMTVLHHPFNQTSLIIAREVILKLFVFRNLRSSDMVSFATEMFWNTSKKVRLFVFLVTLAKVP